MVARTGQADSRQVPAHCKQLVVRFQCYMEPVSDNVDVFCVLKLMKVT